MTYVKDITERGSFEAEPARHCAVASCNSPNPQLYDDNFEQYYCDSECLATYIAENPDRVAEWYARLNVYEV